ncbi:MULTISPECIES: cupin domain-containing protein [Campylobacter]|uniref:cupin domain-containing protein n=1 Tax=Campylobacter TaxID=194 RepID=UPI000A33382B|nr:MULTISPECIES: cupin domain-containing protein [unclassified Campylobacter]MCR8679173.1 cupin domain-containing protein [Campylobacter sp. RM19072]MCR8696001.1 cupin domain-containing protein [Campylobacter sp. RM19073]
MTKIGKNYKMISSQNAPRSEFHDELSLTGCEVSINHLKAGESVPFVHSHKQNEEVYVVIEGSGVLYIDGEEFEVSAGDILRIDPDGKRCFKASSSSDLKYICIQCKASSLEQFSDGDGILNTEKPSWL